MYSEKIKSYALMGYSKNKHTLVIKFTDEKQDGTRKISRPKNFLNFSFSCSAMFKLFHLDPKLLKGQYEPILETIPNKGDFFIIQLN